MISKWLFSGALAFELGSWASLTTNPTLLDGLMFYVVPHAIACALLTAALWFLLPRRFKAPLPWSALLLFSLAFFIPVVGAVGTLFGLFVGLYLQRSAEENGWQATGVPPLPYKPIERWRSPLFNDGGLQDVLRLASDPEQRLAALMATRRMPGHEAAPILKVALRDPEDDVRLLAYSMLDQQETRINQRIEKLLDSLAEAQPHERQPLHAGLARWYWELAYLGLAQGGVLEHVLGQAAQHAQAGLKLQATADLELLAGRVQMERDNLDDAQRHFMQAQRLGMSEEKLIPYLAELAFLHRDYAVVGQQLARLPKDMLERPPFAEAARYWI